jgi:hypothetical protein
MPIYEKNTQNIVLAIPDYQGRPQNSLLSMDRHRYTPGCMS